MSLISREITLILEYGTGADGQGPPKPPVKLTGYRVSVNCKAAGGGGMAQAQIRVYGMKLSDMNNLSTMGLLPTAFRNNLVTVFAGDAGAQATQIFQGTIISAYADMLNAPDVAFNITAATGATESLTKLPATSYAGPVDVATILQGLAASMGVTFENNGVSVILRNPYLPGSAREQAERAVYAAGIQWNGIENGVLAIWPPNSARGVSVTPTISKETGMVGYPTFTSTGLMVTSIFQPTVRIGGPVQVQSDLAPACGTWQVVTVVHDIEANMPNGKWFTQMQLAALGYVAIPK